MTDTDHQDPTGQPHRVAIVQAAPVAFDTDRTIQKVADLAADASRRGARLGIRLRRG